MHNKVSRRVLARTVAAKLLAEPSRRGHWLRVTAAYMMEQQMVDDIDLVVNDIAHELYAQSGHLLVDVTSARKLSDAVRADLRHMLQEATGAKRVELAEHIDPTVLGGLIARTPSHQLDASVRTRLKLLGAIQ
jgi:F-type H+-transporting ATPase subunit delta